MKSPTGAELHIFENIEALTEAFALALADLAARKTADGGWFTLALTGGKTPEPLYRRLAAPDLREAPAWQRVKIFFGDERPVGPADPASNYRLAWETWLKNSPIPRERIFRMEGEAPDLFAAAERYGERLTREVPSGPEGFPALDLILLGLGEDGHVASLFPDSPALDETLRVVTVNEMPLSDTRRLTLTFPTLNAAQEIWFLADGARKAPRVAQGLGYRPGRELLPAGLVRNRPLNIHWWLDRAAAQEIPGV